LAEDEDLEQDSDAYRKWRSGNDNDKYASSSAPSETGAQSGTYTIPENDKYALPGEDDSGGRTSWLDGDLNWPLIIAVLVVFALISSTIFAAMLSSSESDTTPSEWPSTEGIIVKQYDVNTFITEEYCEDQNDDGYLDDWECWKDFVYEIGLVYNYTLDSGNYTINERIEFWEGAWVDDIKREGEEQMFQDFINETDERVALNSTVDIIYNPEKHEDAYSEFVELPSDPLGFFGYFFMCCGGMLCIPIVIVGIIMSWAKNATGMGGYNNRRGWGPFGGGTFGWNNDSGGRNRGATRRSGGTSRSGGGGRSGSGSRGGGGRSGGGGRRR